MRGSPCPLPQPSSCPVNLYSQEKEAEGFDGELFQNPGIGYSILALVAMKRDVSQLDRSLV